MGHFIAPIPIHDAIFKKFYRMLCIVPYRLYPNIAGIYYFFIILMCMDELNRAQYPTIVFMYSRFLIPCLEAS